MGEPGAGFIVANARIYTVDPGFTVAGAMAVQGGRIAAVGDPEELRRRFPGARELDAGGHCVYPGFFDPHCHFLLYGQIQRMADLSGARSWEETVERVRRHHREHPAPWVIGRGWDHIPWQRPELPTRALLDQAFPGVPALLVRIDGQVAVVNGAALERAGVGPGARVEGGELGRDGETLTGLLFGKAIELVRRAVPPPDRAGQEQALLLAQERCFAAGLTSVGNAGTECGEVLLMDELQRQGRLKMRIYAMLRPTEENLRTFLARGVLAADRLTVRSVKLLADGALGSRQALLLEPYADDPGHRGAQVTGTDLLAEWCGRAADAGYQVNTHCIGDGAVRLVLDVYARFLAPGNDCRWRIEHAQVIDPEDLPRFGRYGVIPSVQARHATSDFRWAAQRLGGRIRLAYRYRDLLGQNGWLANGSDFPVEPVNPVLGFHAAVARRDLQGRPAEGFQVENALTREQALRAMTVWSARAQFDEGTRGSLEPGKWADFVIMDRDLMQVPEQDLPAARVLATHVAGEQVYAGAGL